MGWPEGVGPPKFILQAMAAAINNIEARNIRFDFIFPRENRFKMKK